MPTSDETYVFLHIDGNFVPVGLLKMEQDAVTVVSTFAYGRRYLERKNALALDPLQLPLSREDFHCKGVFRAFGDASPDGWGRHLLDRAAEGHGVKPTEFEYLTVLEQDNRVGALAFGATLEGPSPTVRPWRPDTVSGAKLDLAGMIQNVDAVLNYEQLPVEQRRFLLRGSSLGGAEPKAAVNHQGKQWIAKFSRELESWPTCRIELAAMRLAACCGIRVPTCKVIRVGDRDVFLIERFDRTPDSGRRSHFLSSMSLIGANSMTDGAYADIALAIRRFGVAQYVRADLEELFRRMVFNILCNNHDDHLKNHGFLYDSESGGWRLSPAYDIVPQPQLDGDDGGRLSLGVGDQGTIASLDNALSRCADFSLTEQVATQIVISMQKIVQEHWEEENRAVGVSNEKIQLVAEAFKAAKGKGIASLRP